MAAATHPIDDLMEKASTALAAADYFAVEKFALRAADRARTSRDFQRLARIILPLQEARRQRRQQALDAGNVTALRELPGARFRPPPGLFLLEPPLVGMDARFVRDLLARRHIPAMVLAREPVTAKGLWPIVGVGIGEPQAVVARAYVPPPAGAPDPAWFAAAQEALGDAAIAKVKRETPADHRVEDLWEYLEAAPDHEKLAQALEEACREAARTGVNSGPRRRPVVVDPFGF
jgi:hypothetical protein